ncbi:hypothetical protein Tco_0596255 [Tanacetum coccineum]
MLPPLTRRDIIPEAKMPPRKRARFAAPSHRFEIGESSAAAAARHTAGTKVYAAELQLLEDLLPSTG